MQFMPATAKAYGVNPHDEKSSLEGTVRYLKDLLGQFGGDVTKAVAAYNMGPGALAEVIARYGSQWGAHIPAETKDYLAKVLGS